MQGSEVHTVEIVFASAALRRTVRHAGAKKLNTPYPIVMVIGGLLLSFIPGFQSHFKSRFISWCLPPLLFSAGGSPLGREFSYNLVSILLLASALWPSPFWVSHKQPLVLPGFVLAHGIVLRSSGADRRHRRAPSLNASVCRNASSIL